MYVNMCMYIFALDYDYVIAQLFWDCIHILNQETTSGILKSSIYQSTTTMCQIQRLR